MKLLITLFTSGILAFTGVATAEATPSTQQIQNFNYEAKLQVINSAGIKAKAEVDQSLNKVSTSINTGSSQSILSTVMSEMQRLLSYFASSAMKLINDIFKH
ncbi:hypothetical protein BH10PSE19_BH10PSE19_08850 [soil metagenome]